jgi:uncharacterized membrane protein YhaH (DUF805 family)
MSFTDAVRTCLSKYVDFSGRARRSEYWWFALFVILAGVVGTLLDGLFGTRSDLGAGAVQGVINLALLLPSLAVAVRRLHDTSRTGWWILIGLVPVVGWIVLLVFYVQDSEADNEYGPSPKGGGVPTA